MNPVNTLFKSIALLVIFFFSSCSITEPNCSCQILKRKVKADFSGLELMLSASKTKFTTGQPIILFLTFTNKSGKNLTLKKPHLMDFIGLEEHLPYSDEHSFSCKINVVSFLSDYHIEILKKYRAAPMLSEEILILPKDGSYTIKIICSEKFNENNEKKIQSLDHKPKDKRDTQTIPTMISSIPSKIKLSASYKADKNKNHRSLAEIWQGEIKTPPLEIEIIDP